VKNFIINLIFAFGLILVIHSENSEGWKSYLEGITGFIMLFFWKDIITKDL
jgi:hypothetical protein